MHEEQIVALVGLDEVKARWAMSEVASARTSVFYWKSSLKDISSKIAAGSCFEALDASEIKRLVQAFDLARGEFLGHYIQSVLQFRLQSWSRGDFAGVYAMSEMNEGRFVPLFEYAAARGNTDSDPRFIAAKMVATHQPIRFKNPIMPVLIDGYARSVFFLRAGQENDRINAFVPKG